ncbi:membrane protein [Microbacterium phage Dothraki]|uniref:Membrane protein n=2 Tax=Ilzatvirus teagan TaxID=2845595 RepID=A0A516KSP9_9CAUD|nr:membrane protein [Microbacterium phage Stanktossa]QKN87851.1 membrane protein [Microbacterium phage Dothraki]
MSKFDELVMVDEAPSAIDRFHSGMIGVMVTLVLAIAGLGALGVALWYIVQFFWWLLLVFLQGAGPSTGNFQDPEYGKFLE